MIINGLQIPPLLNLSGKKPWEVPHIDTLELWKFGEYKNFISLSLLAHVLGIPTPKDDMDGSQVGGGFIGSSMTCSVSPPIVRRT